MRQALKTSFLIADYQGIRGKGHCLNIAANGSLQLFQRVGNIPGFRLSAGSFIDYSHTKSFLGLPR